MADRATLRLLFTDLDGTFLDHHTYRPGPALPALRRLRAEGVRVLPATSKTVAELHHLRRDVEFDDGWIAENGAAFQVGGALPTGEPTPDGVLGLPYDQVRQLLEEAALAADAIVRGFGDMSDAQVAALTGLAPQDAARARRRQWSETVELIRGDPAALAEALAQRGLRLAVGTRFLTVSGRHSKGDAVRLILTALGEPGRPVRSWAIGDAANDVEMFAAVDHAMLVRGPAGWAPIRFPGLTRLDGVGPSGWVEGAALVLAGG